MFQSGVLGSWYNYFSIAMSYFGRSLYVFSYDVLGVQSGCGPYKIPLLANLYL